MNRREDRPRTPATADIDRLAHVLDELIRVPGTRIRLGLDSILGLVPGGGDLLGGALSAWIVNLLVDTIVGAVPVLGDLFDVAFKANRRNVELVQRYAAQPGEVQRGSRAVVVAVLLVLLAALIGAGLVAFLIVRAAVGLF